MVYWYFLNPLKINEERMSLALEANRVTVWDRDLRAHTAYYSPHWYMMYGYAENELAADENLWQRMIHPDDLERVDRIVQEALANGNRFDFESRRRHKNGHYLPILSRGTVLRDEHGQAVRVIGTNTDLTEQKQLEAERLQHIAQRQQLEKAESLNRMAAAVAHLFNNKLMAVLGNLDLVTEDLGPDHADAGMLKDAFVAADQAAEVSSMMLSYLGQGDGKFDIVDLSAVCRDLLDVFRAALPERITLKADFPSSSFKIRGNLAVVRQMLSNLLTNAREALQDREGEIQASLRKVSAAETVSAHIHPPGWQRETGSYACLEVRDTGCGIRAEELDLIFDPFFTTKFTGRGLGLAVVVGTLRAHKGAIAVESQAGQGAVFRVFLPLEAEAASPAVAAPGKGAAPAGDLGWVLCVDDDPHVRTMTTVMLQRLGAHVQAACDGYEAVAVFKIRPAEFRLVVLDLTMPGIDGWETLKMLREIRSDIPVILASGYDENQVMQGDYAERPQVFLHKPYSKTELRDAVAKAMTRKT